MLQLYATNGVYCLVDDGTNTKLVKHIYATSTLSVGNIGSSQTFSIALTSKPFIHPKDSKLYAFSGYTMAAWDGASLATRAFGTDYNIVSACPFGNNVLVGMVAKDETHSVMVVWDGSTTSSILVDVVNWGNDCLMVLENIGDVAVGISSVSVGGSSDSSTLSTQSAVIVRGYSGGTPTEIMRIESIGGSRIYPLKAKQNDALYFGMDAYVNGTRVFQIWKIYKNGLGQMVCVPDRKVNNDTEITSDLTGLSIVGDYMWVAFTGSFMRTNSTTVFTATSSWTSLVNPNMEVEDRSKKKQLKAISLRCGSPVGSSHTVTLSYSVDGGAFTTIYTGASSSIVRVIEEVAQANGKQFLEAREYVFKIETTGNGEVYELKYGYDVIATNI